MTSWSWTCFCCDIQIKKKSQDKAKIGVLTQEISYDEQNDIDSKGIQKTDGGVSQTVTEHVMTEPTNEVPDGRPMIVQTPAPISDTEPDVEEETPEYSNLEDLDPATRARMEYQVNQKKLSKVSFEHIKKESQLSFL